MTRSKFMLGALALLGVKAAKPQNLPTKVVNTPPPQKKTPIGKQANVADRCPVCLHPHDPYVAKHATTDVVDMGDVDNPDAGYVVARCAACNAAFWQKVIAQ